MTISDYQISSVIKTYLKHVKVRTKNAEKPNHENQKIQDTINISDEGMKKLLERIETHVTERVKRREENYQ